jgi:hypothetical protein
MNALEKLKLTKELRGLLAGMAGQRALSKLQAAKRVREIVLLLGGKPEPIDQKEPTLPQQQEKLLAHSPVLAVFVDAAKAKGWTQCGISWDGAYCTLLIGEGGLGQAVDVDFNVVGADKDKLIVKRWNLESSSYDIIASYPADESNIQSAFSVAEKYVSDQSGVRVPDYTPLFNGIITGTVNVFTTREKLSELEQAVNDLGGDEMPEGEARDLLVAALKEAGRQVLEGQGYHVSIAA